MIDSPQGNNLEQASEEVLERALSELKEGISEKQVQDKYQLSESDMDLLDLVHNDL